MTGDERFLDLLRQSVPPAPAGEPDRDLWPVIAGPPPKPEWSWFDAAVAALVLTTLVISPGWFFLLAFHL